MTMAHQTSEDVLLRYAAGQLRPAPALVVASHLAMSSSSRKLFSEYEQLGGALLDEQPMADVSDNLFEQTLALLDRPVEPRSVVKPQPQPTPRNHDALKIGARLPAPLASREIGRWRWIGPGIHCAKVLMPEDPEHNLILLRVPAGGAIPTHSHAGEEITLVLKGNFYDESGAYRTGDMMAEDEEANHTPMVGEDGECICLISIEGKLRFTTFIGRLVQPFIGL